MAEFRNGRWLSERVPQPDCVNVGCLLDELGSCVYCGGPNA